MTADGILACGTLQAPVEEAEKVFPRPVFVVPLEPNFSIQEGSPVSLECKVEPAADPKLKVEWFLNGKPLAPGKNRWTYLCSLEKKNSSFWSWNQFRHSGASTEQNKDFFVF